MDVLTQIASQKLQEVLQLRSGTDEMALRDKAESAPPCRDLVASLRDCPHVPIIAEIKRSSPSAGHLRNVDDVGLLARTYEAAGAAGLSVLTDGPFFGGDLQDLAKAKESCSLPVLRKDFIMEPIQLYESRVAGADAVLLIAAAVTVSRLSELYEETLALGMTPVVEVHNERELHDVLKLNPVLVGINNRNLATLEVSLETSSKLRPMIPPGILTVAESGIGSAEDVVSLRSVGFDAFLIGTLLMRSPDPGVTLSELCRAEA